MNLQILFFAAVIFTPFLFASSSPVLQKLSENKSITHRDQQIDRALVLYKKGFLEGSEALYRAVLQENPSDFEGFFGLGNIYFKKDR